MDCQGCKRPVKETASVVCTRCKCAYHNPCVNLPPSSTQPTRRWVCPSCVNTARKLRNDSTPVGKRPPSPSQPPMEPAASVPDTAATGLNNCMEAEAVDDLKRYMTELIHSQVGGLRETLDRLVDTIKTQNNRIAELEAEVAMLKNKRVDQCSCDVASFENKIASLQAEITDRDQAMLANDLEVTGCPETPSENCVRLVINIAKKIGVELDEKEIVYAERAGPPRPPAQGDGPPPRPRPLVLRLTRRATRTELLHAARVRRNLSTEGLALSAPVAPLYVNERLSRHNRVLFQRARVLARESQYRFVWTRDGKLLNVRQDQGKPRHRLLNEHDLFKVFGKLGV